MATFEEGFTEVISVIEWLVMGIKARIVEDKQGRMQVIAATPEGKWVMLGFVTLELYLQDRILAEKAIERIRFTKRWVNAQV